MNQLSPIISHQNTHFFPSFLSFPLTNNLSSVFLCLSQLEQQEELVHTISSKSFFLTISTPTMATNCCSFMLNRATLVLLFLILFQCQSFCSESRNTNAFKLRPKPQNNTNNHSSSSSSTHFLNLLPKRSIPTSAPSRKHNQLGLQNWRLP